MESALHLEAKNMLHRFYERRDAEYVSGGTNLFSYVEWPVLFDKEGGGWRGVNYGMVWDDCPDDPVPTFRELCDKGTPPFLIFDIARVYKGGLHTLIEVKHKHAVDEQKMQKFLSIMNDEWQYTNRDVSLVEIEADEIVRCAAAQWQTPLRGRYLYAGGWGALHHDFRYLDSSDHKWAIRQRHKRRQEERNVTLQR